jgi:hypothetical protein
MRNRRPYNKTGSADHRFCGPRLFANRHSHCAVFYCRVETAPGTIWYGAATSFSFGSANPNLIDRTPKAADRNDGGLRYPRPDRAALSAADRAGRGGLRTALANHHARFRKGGSRTAPTSRQAGAGRRRRRRAQAQGHSERALLKQSPDQSNAVRDAAG